MKKVLKKILDFFKWLFKSLLFGTLLILIFNVIGSFINLNIPVNIYTILIVGMLRIPGIAAFLIYSII